MKTRWLYITVSTKKILNNLSHMLKLYGIISLIPVVVSLIYQEYLYTLFFGGIGLSAFTAGYLLYRDAYSIVNKTESLVIAGLSYLLFTTLGALAFLPVSSFLNGFFEIMSGFTTTGLTMFNPQKLPRTLVFFRSYSQWIGGAGIVVLSLAALDIPVRTTLRIASAESVKQEFIGSMKSILIIILKVYAVLTLIGFTALFLAGMSTFDSLIHVFSALSTGGFSSHENSIAFYPSPAIRLTLMMVMLLGAINFSLFYQLGKKKERYFLLKDTQVRYMIGIIIIFALVNILFNTGRSTMYAIFDSVSAMTTTGFSITPAAKWPVPEKLLSVVQMIIGGGDGSTAGGIKLFRFILLVSLAAWFIRRSLLPRSSHTAVRVNGRIISNREIKEVFAFLSLYLGILVLSTFIFTLSGYGIFDSFFESTSSLGTVGLSSGITSVSMAFHLKLLLIFNMWAGRLEILSVLILFNPYIWYVKGGKS
jgi:trk system potassium uptake protein TrkH